MLTHFLNNIYLPITRSIYVYKDKEGREVEITDVEFEVNEGCYVLEAVYVGSGLSCDDDTLDYLTEKYQESLYQDAYENAASHAYDMYKDSYKYGDS